MLTTCRIGGRFSRCLNPAHHTCQYCARDFCETHSHYLNGHEAVCTRKKCRLKQDDLAVHMEYKARVSQRNRAGLCGVEDCGPHPGYQCSLCRGHFCGQHLTERRYPFFDGYSRVDRLASVCPRCWERRKIWRSI
jgi:hypothetical protein